MPASAYWYAYWYALLVRFTGTLTGTRDSLALQGIRAFLF